MTAPKIVEVELLVCGAGPGYRLRDRQHEFLARALAHRQKRQAEKNKKAVAQ